ERRGAGRAGGGDCLVRASLVVLRRRTDPRPPCRQRSGHPGARKRAGGVAEMFQIVLMTVVVAVAASNLGAWRGGSAALATVAATLFPALYIGLPIAALLGIRTLGGARGLFLLMLTVMVSDTSQYYTGRAFGRRPLAPIVSPKKTVEG